MPTVKVRNTKNEEVGEVELSDAVFDAPLNEGLIHAAVRNFMANSRQGTSATKTRGDVSGAGRKLWKQKGTGRARIASLRSPLSERVREGNLSVIDEWSLDTPKTKEFAQSLGQLGLEGKTLIVDSL